MKIEPEDIRDASFDSLREGLDRKRAAVYAAWLRCGPGTTRAVAQRAGMDILSFRPRTTELVKLGLVMLSDVDQVPREGTYEAASAEGWDIWRRLKFDMGVQQTFNYRT